jgi:16S rRNA (guanine527-N7)-methyltransferase
MSSLREFGMTIEKSHAEQFVQYLAHLITWNRSINLTAIIDPKEIIIKHFVDSLTGLAATNFLENGVVLDVGSGGGFPGIPLKIVRPDMRLVLVEPVQKKWSFLNSVVGLLKLQNISTFYGTVEQYAKQSLRHTIDTVVIRALKFDEVRKHVPALLASRGKVVLYRTEPLKDHEIEEEFHLVSETDFALPRGAGKRVVSVIELAKY